MTALLLAGAIIGMITTFAAVMTVGTVRLARRGAPTAAVASSTAAAAGEWLLLIVATLVMVTS